jgi:hypothetical protein
MVISGLKEYTIRGLRSRKMLEFFGIGREHHTPQGDMGHNGPVYKKTGWQYTSRFQFSISWRRRWKSYFVYNESIYCFWDLPFGTPAGPFHEHSSTADKN